MFLSRLVVLQIAFPGSEQPRWPVPIYPLSVFPLPQIDPHRPRLTPDPGRKDCAWRVAGEPPRPEARPIQDLKAPVLEYLLCGGRDDRLIRPHKLRYPY